MSISISRATSADLDDASRLFDAYRTFYAQAPDLPRARGFVRDRLDAADTILAIARVGGRAVGFTHLFPSFTSVGTARLFVLNDLFVAPEARGRGVAEALLDFAETAARQAGAVRLVLQTATDNAAAQRLYERLGWTADESFVAYKKQLL